MRIRDMREDRDLTQQDIADYLFMRQNTYSQYETGRRPIPIEAIIRLAEFYGTSVDYLLELTDDPRPYHRRKKRRE